MPRTKTVNAAVVQAPDMKLFWACIVAFVIATFGFGLPLIVLPEWGVKCNLIQMQLGETAGMGLLVLLLPLRWQLQSRCAQKGPANHIKPTLQSINKK